MKREVSPVVMVVIVILALVVICGLGWHFVGRSSGPTGQNGPKPANGNTMVEKSDRSHVVL